MCSFQFVCYEKFALVVLPHGLACGPLLWLCGVNLTKDYFYVFIFLRYQFLYSHFGIFCNVMPNNVVKLCLLSFTGFVKAMLYVQMLNLSKNLPYDCY